MEAQWDSFKSLVGRLAATHPDHLEIDIIIAQRLGHGVFIDLEVRFSIVIYCIKVVFKYTNWFN